MEFNVYRSVLFQQNKQRSKSGQTSESVSGAASTLVDSLMLDTPTNVFDQELPSLPNNMSLPPVESVIQVSNGWTAGSQLITYVKF